MAAQIKGRFDGRVAIVTGAGSGIGRATARQFAAEGARVACTDIDPEAAEQTAALITQENGDAFGLEVDVRRSVDAQGMVDATLAHYGRIDILFNNAGGGHPLARLHEIDEDVWDEVIARNIKGVFLCSRATIPVFLRQGSGTIVSTASSYGVLAAPQRPGYCTAKAGIIMLTKQLALDYGPTIRVNCVCPGVTATPPMLRSIEQAPDPEARRQQLTKLTRALGRLAEPEEIARAVAYLASDDASFVTGHALVVDGGQTIDA